MSLNIVLKWNIQKKYIKETVAYKKNSGRSGSTDYAMKLLKSNFYFCSDCIVQMNSSNKWLLMEFDHHLCSLLFLFALLWWRNFLSTRPKKLLLFNPYETTISTLISSMYIAYLDLLKLFLTNFYFINYTQQIQMWFLVVELLGMPATEV